MQPEWLLIWLFLLAAIGTIVAVIILVVIDNSTNRDGWG